MPRLTARRRGCALRTPDESYRRAIRIEYLLGAPPAGRSAVRGRRSDADYLHTRTAMPPIDLDAPAGARPVERVAGSGPEPRLVRPRRSADGPAEEWGLDAGACVYPAGRGERGFTVARRRDGGPTLFDEPSPEVGAYGPAKRGGAAPAVATAARCPVEPAPFARPGAAIDQAERLRSGVERAPEQLRRAIDGDGPAGVVTARAILEGLPEAPGGAGEAA